MAMNAFVDKVVRVLSVLAAFALVSGCPSQQSGKHVAWLINATTGTHTKFVYDASEEPIKYIPIEPPLGPNSIRRFEFDDAFRASIKHVGLIGTKSQFYTDNRSRFGYGGTDVIVEYEINSTIRRAWYKEPTDVPPLMAFGANSLQPSDP
jgi:hypothetical protein